MILSFLILTRFSWPDKMSTYLQNKMSTNWSRNMHLEKKSWGSSLSFFSLYLSFLSISISLCVILLLSSSVCLPACLLVCLYHCLCLSLSLYSCSHAFVPCACAWGFPWQILGLGRSLLRVAAAGICSALQQQMRRRRRRRRRGARGRGRGGWEEARGGKRGGGIFSKTPTGPPDPRSPKTPQQQKKKFQKTRKPRLSPKVNARSPKVNARSPKVNARSLKVNVKYF